MGKTTTKQEWRENAQGLLESCVNTAINHVDTKEVQIKIVNSPENHGKSFSGCEVECYRRKQHYEFFVETVEEKTIISVYQKEMCRNAGKYIILAESTPLSQLDYKIQWLYKDMIVNFLLANIIWK